MRGQQGIVFTLLGRFDRYPDAYYEVRLEHVSAALDANPDLLPLYDDAGVACDRLGQHTDAIAWMGRKELALERLRAAGDSDPELLDHHTYTHLANLGTFHVHRWLTEQDDGEMEDVERASDLIGQAIKLNSSAHFGRERYQLLAIDALLDRPKLDPEIAEPSFLARAIGESITAMFSQKDLEKSGYGDAVEGVAGLIRLGAAWESPSIWMAFEHALLARHDSSLARLASLRLVEFHEAGRPPFESFDPTRQLDPYRATLYPHELAIIDKWYTEARESVDLWRASRNAYLIDRIEQGEHPDTHPEFWHGWKDEHPLPKPPNMTLREALFGPR